MNTTINKSINFKMEALDRAGEYLEVDISALLVWAFNKEDSYNEIYEQKIAVYNSVKHNIQYFTITQIASWLGWARATVKEYLYKQLQLIQEYAADITIAIKDKEV